MKRFTLRILGVLSAVLLAGGTQLITALAETETEAEIETEAETGTETETPLNGWYEENGKKYWYENGVRQGTEGRGKEIYDPVSDAWYWLDANAQGAMAVSKDVYQESWAGAYADREDGTGKWVRYDENGHMVKGENYLNGAWYRFDEITGAMVKGWYRKTLQNGSVCTYYYDPITGKMAKGEVEIDGVSCIFDMTTGIGLNQQWYEKDGLKYWYEDGVRQGTKDRGKEIYDPASDAWYWLDAISKGAMAVDKDVYQESWAGAYADREDGTGKWVRYDKNGHMIKGWNEKDGKTYFFDLVTGAMAKGTVTLDGIEYTFNRETGILEKSQGNEPLNYVWDAVKYTYKSADGVVDYYMTVNYDDWDRIVRESTFDRNDRLKGYVTYAYDNDGNLLRETAYNERGNRIYAYVYTYDSEGRETKITYTDAKDASKSYTTTSAYNEYGNLDKQITSDGNGTKTSVTYCYYDTKTRQLLQKNIYSVSNNTETPAYCYVYKYDSSGNMTEEKYSRFEGNREVLIYRDVYSYDRSGRCTTYTEYDENNNKKQYTNYSYYTYAGQSYEREVMTYKADGSVISGYEYERNGVSPIKYTKYTANKAIEYYTVFDTEPSPTDLDATSYVTIDYTYDGNRKLKQIVETEYRLNAYEE